MEGIITITVDLALREPATSTWPSRTVPTALRLEVVFQAVDFLTLASAALVLSLPVKRAIKVLERGAVRIVDNGSAAVFVVGSCFSLA